MRKFLFFLIISLIFISLIFIFSSEKVLMMASSNFLNFSDTSQINLLILGKPGPGYIGPENTDSIHVLHYDKNSNQAFLIPIPRDLIVKDEKGNLEKINALYEKKKFDLLFKSISDFSGFKITKYIAVDLTLITKLIDFLGGLEVNLKEPVVDAVTLYTIPAGKQKLDGYLVELVLRSRYHREGDFFRIKNQIEVLRALKEKLINLNTQEKLTLINFLEKNKYYWQTNLTRDELLALVMQIKDPDKIKIVPIIIDLKSGFLSSGYFNIYNTERVYGIYPKTGINNYKYIRTFIQSEIRKSKRYE